MSTHHPTVSKLPAGSYPAPLLAFGVLAGTLYLSLHPQSHGPVCFFRMTTGIPCPGCGMTRSLTHIWRGDFLLATRFHPLGLPLFVICVCCVLFFLGDRLCPAVRPFTNRVRALFMKNATLSGLAVLMIGVWATRLLLYYTGHHFFTW